MAPSVFLTWVVTSDNFSSTCHVVYDAVYCKKNKQVWEAPPDYSRSPRTPNLTKKHHYLCYPELHKVIC